MTEPTFETLAPNVGMPTTAPTSVEGANAGESFRHESGRQRPSQRPEQQAMNGAANVATPPLRGGDIGTARPSGVSTSSLRCPSGTERAAAERTAIAALEALVDAGEAEWVEASPAGAVVWDFAREHRLAALGVAAHDDDERAA